MKLTIDVLFISSSTNVVPTSHPNILAGIELPNSVIVPLVVYEVPITELLLVVPVIFNLLPLT